MRFVERKQAFKQVREIHVFREHDQQFLNFSNKKEYKALNCLSPYGTQNIKVEVYSLNAPPR